MKEYIPLKRPNLLLNPPAKQGTNNDLDEQETTALSNQAPCLRVMFDTSMECNFQSGIKVPQRPQDSKDEKHSF